MSLLEQQSRRIFNITNVLLFILYLFVAYFIYHGYNRSTKEPSNSPVTSQRITEHRIYENTPAQVDTSNWETYRGCINKDLRFGPNQRVWLNSCT